MPFFNKKPIRQGSAVSKADMFAAAILTGDPTIIRAAISSGMDVNKAGARGTPPIVLASARGEEAIVNLLVSAGADVNQPDRGGGITALQAATLGGHDEVIRQLLAAGAQVNAPFSNASTTALSLAIRANKNNIARTLLEAGADPNVLVDEPGAKDRRGITPLIYAASAGDLPLIRLLLHHKANLEARTHDGLTALLTGAYNGHSEVVRLLVEAGAKANVTPNTGSHQPMSAEKTRCQPP